MDREEEVYSNDEQEDGFAMVQKRMLGDNSTNKKSKMSVLAFAGLAPTLTPAPTSGQSLDVDDMFDAYEEEEEEKKHAPVQKRRRKLAIIEDDNEEEEDEEEEQQQQQQQQQFPAQQKKRKRVLARQEQYYFDEVADSVEEEESEEDELEEEEAEEEEEELISPPPRKAQRTGSGKQQQEQQPRATAQRPMVRQKEPPREYVKLAFTPDVKLDQKSRGRGASKPKKRNVNGKTVVKQVKPPKELDWFTVFQSEVQSKTDELREALEQDSITWQSIRNKYNNLKFNARAFSEFRCYLLKAHPGQIKLLSEKEDKRYKTAKDKNSDEELGRLHDAAVNAAYYLIANMLVPLDL